MRKPLLIPALLLALSLGFSGQARAHEAAGTIPASGTLVSTVYAFIPLGVANTNLFYEAKWKAPLTGSLTGSCSATETGVISDSGSGNWNATGLAACTGTVDGTPGTFNLSFHNKLDPSLTLQGKFDLQGTGGQLVGLSGHGTLAGTPVYYNGQVIGQSIIYTGQLNLGS